jgi:hypothetical protein
MTENEIAQKLNQAWCDLGVKPEKQWSRTDVNNARRGQWETNVLIHNPSHDQLLERLCADFQLDLEIVRSKLFATGVFEKSMTRLAQAVAQSILNGPRLGIEPFVTLHRQGALPGQSALREKLYSQLNGEPLLSSSAFPPSIAAADRPLIRRMFVLAGLSGEEALQCSECLSPVQTLDRKPRRNPSQMKCLELFVTALHQQDVHKQEMKTGEVVRRLKRFGLSKRQFYTARSKSLSAKSLKRTSENRRQVEQMAAALKLDATKFLDVLLEGS